MPRVFLFPRFCFAPPPCLEPAALCFVFFSFLVFPETSTIRFSYSHRRQKGGKEREPRDREGTRTKKELSLPLPRPLHAQQRLPLLLALPGASTLRRLQAQLLPLRARKPQALDDGLRDGEPRRLPVQSVPRGDAHALPRLVGRRLQQSVEVVGRVRPVDEPSRPQDGQREPGGAQVVLCGLLAGEDREEVEDGVRELVGTLFF